MFQQVPQQNSSITGQQNTTSNLTAPMIVTYFRPAPEKPKTGVYALIGFCAVTAVLLFSSCVVYGVRRAESKRRMARLRQEQATSPKKVDHSVELTFAEGPHEGQPATPSQAIFSQDERVIVELERHIQGCPIQVEDPETEQMTKGNRPRLVERPKKTPGWEELNLRIGIPAASIQPEPTIGAQESALNQNQPSKKYRVPEQASAEQIQVIDMDVPPIPQEVERSESIELQQVGITATDIPTPTA